jgi:hypothetical protein
MNQRKVDEKRTVKLPVEKLGCARGGEWSKLPVQKRITNFYFKITQQTFE